MTKDELVKLKEFNEKFPMIAKDIKLRVAFTTGIMNHYNKELRPLCFTAMYDKVPRNGDIVTLRSINPAPENSIYVTSDCSKYPNQMGYTYYMYYEDLEILNYSQVFQTPLEFY